MRKYCPFTSAQPAVDVSVSGEAIYLIPFNMTCTASLTAKLASQLIQFIVLDWVMDDGQNASQIDGVTIEKQHTFSNNTTRSLVFNPLNLTHGATYKCEAKLILPDSSGSFNTSLPYFLTVFSTYCMSICAFVILQYCQSHRQDYYSAEIWSNGSLF